MNVLDIHLFYGMILAVPVFLSPHTRGGNYWFDIVTFDLVQVANVLVN